MRISYLITCFNETDTLKRLLEIIGTIIKNSNDEVIIIIDKDATNNQKTKDLLCKFASQMSFEIVEKKTCKITEHSLANDYGSHKNYGIEQCSGDFIFQIDGDELPPETLLSENLHALLEENPGVEAYAIPRINDFRGVTNDDAKQWGWRLDISPTYKRPRVNWHDPQWRIFKRDYPRISYKRRLHEKIEGYSKYCIIPADENYALYHDKTIEKQKETNKIYNVLFTQEENQGHKPI